MTKREDLEERLLDFAVRCLKLTSRLSKTAPSRHIAGQVMRSSASAGANYQEACGAESRADFVHKLQIVLKELRESDYWLKLINRADLVPDGILGPMLDESQALAKIIGKSVVTAKKRRA